MRVLDKCTITYTHRLGYIYYHCVNTHTQSLSSTGTGDRRLQITSAAEETRKSDRQALQNV